MMGYGFRRGSRPKKSVRGVKRSLRPRSPERSIVLGVKPEILPPRPGPFSSPIPASLPRLETPPSSLSTVSTLPGSGIQVSAVLSIHNRSVLFKRALDGYLWQTLPPDKWEIILLDDMSTEDLRETYQHLLGKINLRHIMVDHTRHPVFKQRNPDWVKGQPASWYHTPAITLNLGFYLARGPVLCICHPEILHAPTNFERAFERISKQQAFLFGTTYLGIQDSNRWLDRNSWASFGWAGFLARAGGRDLKKFSFRELYWYTSFLSKEAAHAVAGVDFRYLNGVAGEDDDFKERVRLAGWPPVYAPELEGFHQDHSHERESQHRRDTETWRIGLKSNRELYNYRRREGFLPWKANLGFDWACTDCAVGEISYAIGSKHPVAERKP